MAKTLLDVLNEEKIELFDSTNGRWVARCPFHEGDRNPSFTVYPNDTYYCFGCQVWGNPVKFLVEYKGMSSREAFEYVGVDYAIPKSEKKVIKVRNYVKTTKFLFGIAEEYHNYLRNSPGPVRYLMDRGLLEGTISRYKLGYTDGAVLGLQFVEDLAIADEVGLLNRGGYEALSHRIIIPNLVENTCDFMIGRTVINDRVKYLGLRMPKPIMGFHELRQSPIIFLVEGQFDWLLLRQWNYPAAVISGSHITKPNVALLKTKKIVYIPDNDVAGQKAAASVKSQIPGAIILDTTSLGTKDISEAAESEYARDKFDALIAEQVVWQSNMLPTTLMKWLPISETTLSFPST